MIPYTKDLFDFYDNTLTDVCAHDSDLLRNLSRKLSVFSTATFNFGPATVTLPHIDFRNLAWGWCAITALGDFDPDLGGHLVLWDLKLIIRFPPRRHHPYPIRHPSPLQPGLFRWVYNGFRTDKDIDKSAGTSAAEHERRKKDRARRWADGIKMYSVWEGPVKNI
ncbi:hypothetical protein R3P38DRAFT_3168888 [Favolaschia claudopus]|uniref:Uncharacterized protein n=1 Tax=Favolaschia claudopus TaxID=2862362 RepID=A0AAW0DZF6_9AGAR